jgi:hypothetical protein
VILKACSICGRPSPTSRCSQHPKPPKRSGSYTRNAAKVRASATSCYLCGKPFTAEDPAVADHVKPRAFGGSDNPRQSESSTPILQRQEGRHASALDARGGRSDTGGEMTASATRNLRLPYSVLHMRAWFDSPLLGAWRLSQGGGSGSLTLTWPQEFFPSGSFPAFAGISRVSLAKTERGSRTRNLST